MSIQITRIDPLAGCPDNHDAGVLSVERCPDWPAAFAALRARGIPLTGEHEAEFRGHADTQFTWHELVTGVGCAFSCKVHYDVREVLDGDDVLPQTTEQPLPAREPYRRGIGAGFGATEDGDI